MGTNLLFPLPQLGKDFKVRRDHLRKQPSGIYMLENLWSHFLNPRKNLLTFVQIKVILEVFPSGLWLLQPRRKIGELYLHFLRTLTSVLWNITIHFNFIYRSPLNGLPKGEYRNWLPESFCGLGTMFECWGSHKSDISLEGLLNTRVSKLLFQTWDCTLWSLRLVSRHVCRREDPLVVMTYMIPTSIILIMLTWVDI